MPEVIFFKVTEDCQTLEQALASWQQGKSIKLLLGKNSENCGAFKRYGTFYLTVSKERLIEAKELGPNDICLQGKDFIVAIDFTQGIGSLTLGSN